MLLTMLSFSLSAAESNLLIVLCIGQSNMAGRAPIPVEATKPLKGVLLLNEAGQWEPAVAPLNIDSTIRKDAKMQKLGMAWSFARDLAAHFPKNRIGLVHNARGGTAIKDWQKGKQYYVAAMKRLKPVLKQGRLLGIIWHQGESDRGNKNYQADMAKMFASWRQDLGMPSLPVVVGEVRQDAAMYLNADIAGYAASDRHCGLAKAADLVIQDFAHFNTDSQLELGSRYAAAFISLLKAK